MADSLYRWYEQVKLTALLDRHTGLHVLPCVDELLVIAGTIAFEGPGQNGEILRNAYDIKMWVPPSFPEVAPLVQETGERIPPDFHKLEGNFLCLGSPTEIRLRLKESATLPDFVQYFVVPYLFGHAFFCKYGTMPFGELAHGEAGIHQYLCELFATKDAKHVLDFLRLAGMKKGVANKQPCPCGSGRRLGKCHNRRVNQLRRKFGTGTFREEYERHVRSLPRKGQ